VKLHAFMTTPELAGAELSGPSWSTWRIIARLIDGDPNTAPLRLWIFSTAPTGFNAFKQIC
jgi:hypothetical protein